MAEYPNGLLIERDYDASVPELRGDREQLIQALLNVVRNAAQALQARIASGDACVQLRTRVAQQVTMIRRPCRLALDLRVIDNGPGIPEELKERVFDPLVSGREAAAGWGFRWRRSSFTRTGARSSSKAFRAGPIFGFCCRCDEAETHEPIWIVDDDPARFAGCSSGRWPRRACLAGLRAGSGSADRVGGGNAAGCSSSDIRMPGVSGIGPACRRSSSAIPRCR